MEFVWGSSLDDVTVEVGVVGHPNDVILDVGVVTSLLSHFPFSPFTLL